MKASEVGSSYFLSRLKKKLIKDNFLSILIVFVYFNTAPMVKMNDFFSKGLLMYLYPYNPWKTMQP